MDDRYGLRFLIVNNLLRSMGIGIELRNEHSEILRKFILILGRYQYEDASIYVIHPWLRLMRWIVERDIRSDVIVCHCLLKSFFECDLLDTVVLYDNEFVQARRLFNSSDINEAEGFIHFFRSVISKYHEYPQVNLDIVVNNTVGLTNDYYRIEIDDSCIYVYPMLFDSTYMSYELEIDSRHASLSEVLQDIEGLPEDIAGIFFRNDIIIMSDMLDSVLRRYHRFESEEIQYLPRNYDIRYGKILIIDFLEFCTYLSH
jgi:hypothetical protein